MLCSSRVGWRENTLGVTLLALNSWTCKRSVTVLTAGKVLLRTLVILSFLTLQTWFRADLTTIPLVFTGPKFLPGLRRESRVPFPSPAGGSGFLHDYHGHSFLVTSDWCSPGQWHLLAGGLWSEMWLPRLPDPFSQEREKIWYQWSLNGKKDSTVVLERWKALWSLVHERLQGPLGRSENWFSRFSWNLF